MDIISQDKIKGILIDADGTLGPHHTLDFESSILDHVQAILKNGLKVAIYTNAAEDRFQIFKELGVKMVNNVPPKSDSSEFEIAMNEFLELPDPSKICMIGDNYIQMRVLLMQVCFSSIIQHDSTKTPRQCWLA